jgi:hypothetical protein
VYRKLEESSGNVLGYETRGKLTEEDLGVILADVEEATDRFGKVNLLVSLGGSSLFTELPRRVVPGDRASGIANSRKFRGPRVQEVIGCNRSGFVFI